MKSFLPSLLKAAGGRVARNIYFWLLLIGTRMDYAYTPTAIALSATLFGLLALLFYTNNLLLIPRFLAKKNYGLYFPLYAVLVLVIALLYTGILKWTLIAHPEVPAGMISPITTLSETTDRSFYSLLTESLSYYAVLFIAGALFAMSWFVMNYQRLQTRADAAQKKYLETELNFLKSQINPHFLFNTLNNLYALTVKKSDDSPQVVAQLSTILRYFLYESDTRLVSSQKEMDMMQAYIDLERLRIDDDERLDIRIEADKTYMIPPLLWVPILENIFKHATRTGDAAAIYFHFRIDKDVLTISSKNSSSKRADNAASGIGLPNLQKRLELLYPDRHKLEIIQDDHNFSTNLQIELS